MSRKDLRRIAAALGLAGALLLAGLAFASVSQAATCTDCDPGPGGGGTSTTYNLTITVNGSGSVGDGSSSCSSTCTWAIAKNATVHLSQSAFYGYAFSSWSGPCAGAATCDITLDGNKAVTATFADVPPAEALIDSPTDGQLFTSTTGGAVTVGFQIYDPTSQWDRIECLVDGVSRFKPCTTGFSTGPLATGTHTVTIRQVDSTNNVGDTNRTFKVVNLPASKITTGPPAIGGSRTATFQYSGGDGQRCALDAADPSDPAAWTYASCPTSLANLADGVHTLSVQTYVSFEGTNYHGSIATRSWRVDTTAPETAIDAMPPATTSDASAGFAFHGTDATALTYECKLDAQPFGPCPGAAGKAAYGKLAVGKHDFRVRAKDAVGLVDPTPAAYSWTVVSVDADGDGFFNSGTPKDCNDANPKIHPGAPEVLDNDVDENCDGVRGINLDRDGDGVQRPGDCDDANAAIKPGAYDKPGDAIDQDCTGAPADYARPGTSLSSSWAVVKGRTVFPVFKIGGAPNGAEVTVSCTGKGCSFKRKTIRLRGGKADLRKLVKRGIPVGRGATIDVRTVVTDMLMSVIRTKVAKSGAAKTTKLCIRPGAKTTFSCG